MNALSQKKILLSVQDLFKMPLFEESAMSPLLLGRSKKAETFLLTGQEFFRRSCILLI